jgi:DHA1 family bicyclomycin/chloramphenicol resistance-like MFS transporter
MLAGRFLQGFGLAAARVISVALIRDQYHGDEMARVMSFVMSIFILVPTVAPALGQGILLLTGWRMIFGFILVLTLITFIWFLIRQIETLPIKERIPFSISTIASNIRQVCLNRVVLGYTVMAGLVFSGLLGYLSSVQQIFQGQYQLGKMFPLYFAVLALAIGSASYTNGKLVMHYGMHTMSRIALISVTLISTIFFVTSYRVGGHPQLWALMLYLMIVLFCLGILMGNLNALAMKPLGHMAGIGASVVGALTTFISVPFGMVVGQSYNNTVLPLVGGFALFSVSALVVMYWVSLEEATKS